MNPRWSPTRTLVRFASKSIRGGTAACLGLGMLGLGALAALAQQPGSFGFPNHTNNANTIPHPTSTPNATTTSSHVLGFPTTPVITTHDTKRRPDTAPQRPAISPPAITHGFSATLLPPTAQPDANQHRSHATRHDEDPAPWTPTNRLPTVGFNRTDSSFAAPRLTPPGSSPLPQPSSQTNRPITPHEDFPPIPALLPQTDEAQATNSIASRPAENQPRLAQQPKVGDHFFDPTPQIDKGVALTPVFEGDFSLDPIYEPLLHDPQAEQNVYDGKTLNANQRPWVEWGRKLYSPGLYPKSLTLLGNTNLITPQLLVYGDFRTAFATNRQQGNSQSVLATRLNLDIDFELTATERFHAFIGPLDEGNQFTRVVYDGGEANFVQQFDPEFDFGYFEGDAGSIVGGFTGSVMPFTLPFTAGVIPMVVQNGYWIDDAFLGLAATIPARNSSLLDISNYDTTFFFGWDKINSPAFGIDDNAAKVMGVTTWIEAYGGYWELGYAFVDDRDAADRGYHNLSAAYSTRIRHRLSTSLRVIANAGQSSQNGLQTADGVFVVWENSLITPDPWTFVPYFNVYGGFDRPQSVARAGGAGGILRNVGINFETDGLTGYPTLDSSANNTWGGAVGINLLPRNLTQQWITEFAMVQPLGSDANRIARGPQYGVGMRYQLPISNSVILRLDGMAGFLENDEDISGFRVELRHKF